MTTIRLAARRAALPFAAALALLAGALPARAALPIQHWSQPSGAQVYYVDSPSIPIVDVQVDFDGGSRRDPAQQAGLADAIASVAPRGVEARGSDPALDENALGEAWADLGASFDASAGSDRFGFSLRSLSDPALLGRAVALAARQIGEPAFAEDVWQRERARAIAALKEAQTRPGAVAGRAYGRAVYGGHPYGFTADADTLGRIGVDDLRAAYAARIQSCRAKVSIVGAVTRAQADGIAAALLSRLPAASTGCSALPPVADVPALAAPQDIRIPFNAAQAHVHIGQPGVPRSDPAYFALTVGNYVLGGGGFVSRLTEEVREKRGLSYSVYSAFAPGLHAGAFTASLQTRPDQAAQAVEVARGVIARFVADGPTEKELRAAKANLVGGFALRIDSNAKLIANVANIAWYDLPLDYLDTWTQQVEKVTAADVRAAFSRVLQPQRMVTVVVGGRP
ncbi:M16 family metallopeptidase [Xylophilus sp.]|uniref:M16 family metallopeptidase n=1 Tax=Xylophilus sp. TaxID=2653893 RepID=UPI002D80A7B4|nr:pitrilysin family protein [Xylophilus sp.]